MGLSVTPVRAHAHDSAVCVYRWQTLWHRCAVWFWPPWWWPTLRDAVSSVSMHFYLRPTLLFSVFSWTLACSLLLSKSWKPSETLSFSTLLFSTLLLFALLFSLLFLTLLLLHFWCSAPPFILSTPSYSTFIWYLLPCYQMLHGAALQSPFYGSVVMYVIRFPLLFFLL